MSKTIYRSPEGEARVMALYENGLKRLGVNHERRVVQTRFDSTHMIIAGPGGAPPLLLLHGAHTPSPFVIELFKPLLGEFRVYAPDIIGQPGLSSQARPAPRDNNYGKWLCDVMDGAGLERAAIVGISFGAAIVLDTAACAPERITDAVLVTPVGLTGSIAPKLFKRLSVPWLLYRVLPGAGSRVTRFFWDRSVRYDSLFFSLFETVMRDVKLYVKPPGPFTAGDLKRFTSPALVLLAKDDALIPFSRAMARAKEIMPNATVEVFDGPHIPQGPALEFINRRISAFLKEEGKASGSNVIYPERWAAEKRGARG